MLVYSNIFYTSSILVTICSYDSSETTTITRFTCTLTDPVLFETSISSVGAIEKYSGGKLY